MLEMVYEAPMQTQQIDAIIAIFDRLSRENSELALRKNALEHLLSRHDRALYQEYMDWINDPRNQVRQQSFAALRAALTQNQ